MSSLRRQIGELSTTYGSSSPFIQFMAAAGFPLRGRSR